MSGFLSLETLIKIIVNGYKNLKCSYTNPVYVVLLHSGKFGERNAEMFEILEQWVQECDKGGLMGNFSDSLENIREFFENEI